MGLTLDCAVCVCAHDGISSLCKRSLHTPQMVHDAADLMLRRRQLPGPSGEVSDEFRSKKGRQQRPFEARTV